jgi:probable phosphoglycerate mutase
MSPNDRPRLIAVRHGTTEWSRARRHTGRSDVPLEPEGRAQAVEVGLRLAGHGFRAVYTSPLERARETCTLAGFGEVAKICEDLAEWDYGEMEGLTTEEVRLERPGWDIWTYGVVGGETLGEVSDRAERVVEMVRSSPGDVLVFAHAHILRIVATRWVGSDARNARSFSLAPATISILGWERETPVVSLWNAAPGNPLS